MFVKEKVNIEKALPNPHVPILKTFRFVNSNYLGIGEQALPFVYFDSFINRDLVYDAHHEVLYKKHFLIQNRKLLSVNGIVPKEINQGHKSIDSILCNYEKYLNQEQIQKLSKCKYLSEIKKVANESLAQKADWDLFIHLRSFSTFANKSSPSEWRDFMVEFPMLRKLIESLPIKKLGYAVMFFSNPGVPIYTHRDIYPREEAGHFININLDLKPRKFYIYDSLENKKIYRDPDSFSYLFNESDFHGAEAEENQRITLRVEGVFDDFVQNDILKGKPIFSWNFERTQEVLLKNYSIIEDTDI